MFKTTRMVCDNADKEYEYSKDQKKFHVFTVTGCTSTTDKKYADAIGDEKELLENNDLQDLDDASYAGILRYMSEDIKEYVDKRKYFKLVIDFADFPHICVWFDTHPLLDSFKEEKDVTDMINKACEKFHKDHIELPVISQNKFASFCGFRLIKEWSRPPINQDQIYCIDQAGIDEPMTICYMQKQNAANYISNEGQEKLQVLLITSCISQDPKYMLAAYSGNKLGKSNDLVDLDESGYDCILRFMSTDIREYVNNKKYFKIVVDISYFPYIYSWITTKRMKDSDQDTADKTNAACEKFCKDRAELPILIYNIYKPSLKLKLIEHWKRRPA